MSEEPRKRSRFDQTAADVEEQPPARKSRFDRRSRSPAANDNNANSNARERSPVKSVESPAADGDKKDAAAKAAEAAARINAQLQNKKGIQHVDVPPIRSVSTISNCLFSR